MKERIYTLKEMDPVEVYGVNDRFIKSICSHFPNLKVVPRGEKLIMKGEEEQIEAFLKVLEMLIAKRMKKRSLSMDDVDSIFETLSFNSFGGEKGADSNDCSSDSAAQSQAPEDIIVYGNEGKIIRARTKNQKRLVDDYQSHDLIFATGPAGTGKTYTAIALAVRALKNREVKRLILTRPAVEAGERLGFLPGDLKDKLDPYLQPLYDALQDMVPAQRLKSYMEDGTIQIAPLAYMRGRTLESAFVILDEAQNTNLVQLKMFLTRMGNHAKFIVTGDITQIDLPNKGDSGLKRAMEILKGIPGISYVNFTKEDIVRHPLVTKIVKAFEGNE
ncbi:MAG: PhoH family protein [bacterium]|nr:PhoH family protein [Bacteroidales bacterium]MDD7236137.1 PhoH family protein [bacterium]MDY2649832.1 PhoH family protein [Candidatus Egerieousia sp.]